MADKKEAEDLELGEVGKSPGKKKLIIIAAAAVLLIGGGVTGFLLMKGGDKKAKATAEHSEEATDEEHASDDEAAPEEESEEHAKDAEEEHAGDDAHAEEESAEEGAEGHAVGPVYLDLGEPIIANLPSEKKSRTIKVQVTFVMKNAAAEARVKKHLPLLKSELLMLLSTTTVESLSTAEGQQAFRDQAFEKMKATVSHEEKKPYIEKLLFTQFVMQ